MNGLLRKTTAIFKTCVIRVQAFQNDVGSLECRIPSKYRANSKTSRNCCMHRGFPVDCVNI